MQQFQAITFTYLALLFTYCLILHSIHNLVPQLKLKPNYLGPMPILISRVSPLINEKINKFMVALNTCGDVQKLEAIYIYLV